MPTISDAGHITGFSLSIQGNSDFVQFKQLPWYRSSGGLRSDRTKLMISTFCPASKAFTGQTLASSALCDFQIYF